MFNFEDLKNKYSLSVAEIRVLIEKIAKEDFTQFMAGLLELDKDQETAIDNVLLKIKDGIVFDYACNVCEFMGLDFYVDENVLIPRHETELLVEEVEKHIFARKSKVLELGVGSGCVSVSLAKRNPSSDFVAVDVSEKAIRVAQRNASAFELDNLEIFHSDLTSEIKELDFDLIVANLPYVESDYIKDNSHLMADPLLALDGGKDGLDLIKRLLQNLDCLKDGGYVFLEFGYLQNQLLQDFVKEFTDLEFIKCIKDYAGHDRIFIVRKQNG